MKQSKVLWLQAAASLILLISAGLISPRHAQDSADLKATYAKSEHLIPMRDGVRLFTIVYAPKDASDKYPIILFRTPYGIPPYGADAYRETLGPSTHFSEDKYIFVYQDVRGRYMSEGQFADVRPHKEKKSGPSDTDESSDTYDTIDWLVKNVPNNNGRVGMWGISYPGFYTSMAVIDAHPALKAASPQAPIADWFVGDDFHHNGTLFLAHSFNFFSGFGRARPKPTTEGAKGFVHFTPDGYKFFLDLGPLANVNKNYFKGEIAFWNQMMEHPNYDEFWKARNIRPHLKNIKPAVMTVGGWFDAEDLFGALATYKAIEAQSPGAYNILVMGPWFHGGWSRSTGESLGNVQFGSKTSEFYRDNILRAFFDYHLKGKGELKLPEAYVFETGSNQWRTYAEWPPKNAVAKNLYFNAGGKLAFEAPKEENAFDEYVSDPARPVPYISGMATGMTREYMTDDQRFAGRRPDVVVYQTGVLTEDVRVAGPVTASLFVTTTGTDSDFVVKLIDVYPNDAPDNQPNPAGVSMGGYEMLVRGEPMRARFRNGFEKPEAMTPGKVTKVEFVMPDVNHTFLKGHRIMAQVQSSWFPLVDRNPQKFVDVNKATEADFQKATQRIYRAGGAGSHLVLNVLN